MNGCQRCGSDTNITTMSFFNTQMICMECDKKEKAHSKYKEARDAELAQVKQGNFNYEGIGKPADL